METYPIWDGRHNFANYALIGITLRQGQDKFHSSEQLYQFTKFLPSNEDIRNAIKAATRPEEAKNIAREHKDQIRPDWEDIRYQTMQGIIQLKFDQHPELRSELKNTGEAYIYEDADQYAPENPTTDQIAELRRWGIYKGDGSNWMGKILMDIRDRL